MPRTLSRAAVGASAVILSLAYPGAASADAGSGTDSFAYTCTDQDDSSYTESDDIEFSIEAPADAEVGQPVEVSAEPANYSFFSFTDGGEITEGTLTVQVLLGGEAAPQASITASVQAEDSFGEDDEETFDEGSLTGSFTPTAPGEVVLSPGDVTIEVDQDAGPSTTVCTPDSTPDGLATVTVAGDAAQESPAASDTPQNTGSGDSGTSAPQADSADSGRTLMIVAAVVGGLMLVGAAVVLGVLITVLRRR
ncbi:transmembrane domain-containing protein [Nocardiopsis sediminis]|uniref:Transmembrane domain-containing protein n=1 Tax=Nocardiopsis sediminis TaxID=1778267 RepID=A0ABV8FUE6_9ACTN